MKYAGFGLFVTGLIVSAWYAAYVPEGTGAARIANWAAAVGAQFGAGFVTMLIGVAIARVAAKKEAAAANEASDDGSASPRDAAGALRQMRLIASKVDDLAVRDLTTKEIAVESAELAEKIDLILSEEVPAFLDARPQLIERYGLEFFAELIGHFAVMERATARAWSAITDEAYDEVNPSLAKAQAAIHRALDVAEKV